MSRQSIVSDQPGHHEASWVCPTEALSLRTTMGRLSLPNEDNIWVYDLEVFSNFFLATAWAGVGDFWSTTSPRVFAKWLRDKSRVLVGFNNFDYDDIIARYVEENEACSPSDIFELSKKIIEEKNNKTVFKLKYSRRSWAFSVDIFQLLNKKGALKEWECRMGSDRVVESHYDFLKPLPKEGEAQIKDYCENDVRETHRLAEKNWHLATLRYDLIEQYALGDKPYCLSEAGVAQHVFMTLHEQRTEQQTYRVRDAAKESKDNKVRHWQANDIVFPLVKFRTPEFQAMFETLTNASPFVVGDSRGIAWKLRAEEFKKPVQLGGKKYQLGVGGLHSVDGPGHFVANKSQRIIDLDVESYYPAIMIEHKLTPRHLGAGFTKDFFAIRAKRLEAKHTGNKKINEALKIVINSTFGKLNDEYSPLRSIPDALRVTINGQLMLLMLVESLEMVGFEILSANTDGITILAKRGEETDKKLTKVIASWESVTKFKLEQNDYQRYIRRDVNAYLALKEDGKIKSKGIFDPEPMKGKWDGTIVKRAAQAYLMRDIDPRDTVYSCHDARQFLYYQRVGNGGYASLGQQRIGKTVRWYIAKKGEQVYRVNPPGSKVGGASIPNGENAKLALDITDWDLLGVPPDLNRDYYVQEAWDLIATTRPKEKKK